MTVFANQITEESVNQVVNEALAKKDVEHGNLVRELAKDNKRKMVVALAGFTELMKGLKEAKSHPRSRTPTRQARSRRTIQEYPDSETKAEDPPTPVKSPVTRRRENREKKVKKVKKATTSISKDFKAGGNYMAGIQWNYDWSKELKSEFKKAEFEWQHENGKTVPADKLANMKKQVAQMKRKFNE